MKIIASLSLLFVFVAYVSSVRIQFPATNPCMLVEIGDSSHVDLSNGTEKVSYDFANVSIAATGSSCDGDTMHNLRLNVGEGVMNFMFTRGTDQSSSLQILYSFTPSNVFEGSTDTAVVIADDIANTNNVKAPNGTSYLCQSENTILFNTDRNYTCELLISGVQMQAFNLQNGEFSNATICAADAISTSPTTTTTQSTTTTTPPTTTGSNTTVDTNTTAAGNTTLPTTEPMTEPSNTTNSTTPSTTSAPTTTPAPATTTAPPQPEVKTYQFGTGSEVCIVFKAAMSLNITYDTKEKQNVPITINVPNTTVVDAANSFCGLSNSTSQKLTLKFFPSDWELSMLFTTAPSSMLAKAADTTYSLQNLTLTYSIDANFPDANNTGQRITVNAGYEAGSTLQATGSYKCDKDTTLKMNDQVSLMTKSLQYQAFSTANSTDFNSDVTECPSDSETNSIVPIAVGAALAGLVIIVLIAYLIGRRRSRGGYEHV